MIVVDANLLIYSVDTTSPYHAAARKWWDQTLSGDQAVALTWESINAFVRITTNARVFKWPSTVQAAIDHVNRWLDQPNVRLITPTNQHWQIFSNLLIESGCTGNLITDAQLAALAIEHDAVLCTTDQDFARFQGLQWRNPIQ